MGWKDFSDIKKTIIISIIILLVQIPCFLISYGFGPINGAIRFIFFLLSLTLQFVYMLFGVSWSIPVVISLVMYALLLGTIIFLIIKIAKKPQPGTEINKKKYWIILIAIIVVFVILYFLFVITGIAMVSIMRIDCTLRGQDWREYWDGYGQTSCPRVYSDGGKICYSSDECEGDCLTNNVSNLGKVGICETDKKIRVMCQNPIENKHLECRWDKNTIYICEPDSEDWVYNCLNFRDNDLVVL